MPKDLSEIPPSFKGFLYEPSTEQEVVGLFFRRFPWLDLPLCIDEVRTDFSDCLAWRETENGYEEVKIEFELSSQNFLEHGHDPPKNAI